MTRDELLDTLLAMAGDEDGDAEQRHADADRALLRFIADNEITAAYHAIQPKWYS